MADKLRGDQSGQARRFWAEKGKETFVAERKEEAPTVAQEQKDRA